MVPKNTSRRWRLDLEKRTYVENLEVEDAGVVLGEALIRRDHSVQQLLIHRQAGDGCQQPAVTCQWQNHEL